LFIRTSREVEAYLTSPSFCTRFIERDCLTGRHGVSAEEREEVGVDADWRGVVIIEKSQWMFALDLGLRRLGKGSDSNRNCQHKREAKDASNEIFSTDAPSIWGAGHQPGQFRG
jgi:hypothetical protein